MDNQYNNGFGFNDPNQMNNNQYPEPQNNRRGGGFISFLIALIVAAALIVFLLDYTGYIDAKSLYHKITKTQMVEKKEEPKEEEKKEIPESQTAVPYEEEFRKMCQEVDEEGKYNYGEFIDRVGNRAGLPENPTEDQVWQIYRGLKYCIGNVCFINEDDDSKTVNRFSCTTGEFSLETFKAE